MKNNEPANQQDDTTLNIQSAKVFSNSVLAEPETKNIKPKAILDMNEPVDILLEDTVVEDELKYRPKNNSRSSRKKWWLLLGGAIFVTSIVEFSLFVIEITRSSDWLGAIWLGVFITTLVFLFTLVISELKGLRQLKRQTEFKKESNKISSGPTMGLAESHCLNLAQNLPQNYQFLVQNWRNSVDENHNDHEIMCLFEDIVLTPIDRVAIKQIANNASAAGVMIAVSPFALLDMLIVLWRNIRLMNQISEIYGLQLGYWGRVRLIRNTFNTMLYAGASEILSDAGNYALGAGITGRLSTRVAQGLGAGILTSRIGIKAMEQCRPLNWGADNKPSIGNISKQLLAELNSKIN
ncbi:YcjF family protein [Paraglaciecola sp. 2405UD69-4]|uniref:YcjF family protein n=1 Tax=Paraglaciecola sp. 2405UD69-4 TaxID=3391836 RepID=UPI0039C92432